MFQLLFWTGMRSGELLALTVDDFDFAEHTVSISKNYARHNKEDLILPPKTPKSKRIITLPPFPSSIVERYPTCIYVDDPHNRLFNYTKHYLHHEMDRGCKKSGVQRIRIHDLRHSHASFLIEKGVLPPSFMDFSLPSEFAQNALYYVSQFGHFLCNQEYAIHRTYLDQYLLLYICQGSLYVNCSQTAVATADQICLFDCRQPHHYWCEDSVDFYWFHFNGCSSSQYTDSLVQRFGLVHTGFHIHPLKEYFIDIIQASQLVMTNEHQISQNIHNILGGLSVPDSHLAGSSALLMPAVTYIHRHFAENISLDQLTAQCGISKSHFIRNFQAYTGHTPHEYLLLYRLRQAKRLLLGTDLSVEEIAARCGFNSASHFTRAFRAKNNLTPTDFRRISF